MRTLMVVLAVGLVLLESGNLVLGYGDHNGDGTVDLADFAEFGNCMAGPGGGLRGGCDVFDFDTDLDVDQVDFAEFQQIFGSSFVVIDTVPVENPGNAGEWAGTGFGGSGPKRVCGAVDYNYDIGKYEITAAQYTEFLNAVAKTDTHNLYNAGMWDNHGCWILQTGSPGHYAYSVASDYANRPVNYVSWADAARFCNWLHNGQPTGLQDLTTTEDGSYFLNGAISEEDLLIVGREDDATWVIPTEDEWYKAAYHKNDGATANYFDYPTSSDIAPSNVLDGGGNNATFYDYSGGGHTIGEPYWRTEVGAHVNSESPYGTFDQGGNVSEIVESLIGGLNLGKRGGYYYYYLFALRAADLSSNTPLFEDISTGFRVARIHRSYCDNDGDIDLADLVNFETCLFGPGVVLSKGCECYDYDDNGSIDLLDYARFQQNFGSIESPPGMALIPAGEFQMGDTFGDGDSDELPVHSVYVDAFYFGIYEVTNQQYADALNWAFDRGNRIAVIDGLVYMAGSGTSCPYCETTTSSRYCRIIWDGSKFSVPFGKENHPMVNVSWYGAVAYANWRSEMEGKPLGYDLSSWECNFNGGYRLPTEAEWEKAAQGGVDGRRFTWGNTINHAHANYWASEDCYSYDDSTYTGFHPDFDSGSEPYTSPVGYFAANGYGLHDMVGGVEEWCNDFYNASYYRISPYSNPHGPPSSLYLNMVLRGGSWGHDANYSRLADRYCTNRHVRHSSMGFRLVLGLD